MHKMYYSVDEAYPVVFLAEDDRSGLFPKTLDLTDEELARFNKATSEWRAVQELLLQKIEPED